MPHMFVNRSRYHTGIPHHLRGSKGRHERPTHLLLGLRRFSSWPPPGKRGRRNRRQFFQRLEEQMMDPHRRSFSEIPLDLFKSVDLHPTDGDDAYFFWETFNTAAYELGGIIFIVGSIAFLPAYHAYLDLGVYLFIFGSILYLIVAVHDTFEVLEAAEEDDKGIDEDDEDDTDEDVNTAKEREDKSADETKHSNKKGKEDGKHFSRTMRYRLDLGASLIYVAGSILFIVGSFAFLPSIERSKLGAWLFIFGSILFVIGSIINMVQIFESHDGAAASLMTAICANLTAAFYLIGSTMFAVASVPYLFDFEATADANLIFTFLGWNYILGSVAFTVGGTINYIRARIVLQDQVASMALRKEAQEQIRDLHKVQKEQNYKYNYTWSAKPSAKLYQGTIPTNEDGSAEDDNEAAKHAEQLLSIFQADSGNSDLLPEVSETAGLLSKTT